MANKELKHRMIENYILKKIESGEYKVGDQIPTEFELCEQFNVGRMTVNKAINSLANRNLIKRISGKGSFVMRKVSRSVTTVGSFTRDMENAGMKASSRLIEYRICTAQDYPEEAQELMLKPTDTILYFRRIRYGDDIPIALADTFLAGDMFPDFNPAVLKGSLDEYMTSQGVVSEGFIVAIEAIMAQKEQKRYLDLPLNEESPLLRSTTKRFKGKKPYEYTRTAYVSNHFEYIFSGGDI